MLLDINEILFAKILLKFINEIFDFNIIPFVKFNITQSENELF